MWLPRYSWTVRSCSSSFRIFSLLFQQLHSLLGCCSSNYIHLLVCCSSNYFHMWRGVPHSALVLYGWTPSTVSAIYHSEQLARAITFGVYHCVPLMLHLDPSSANASVLDSALRALAMKLSSQALSSAVALSCQKLAVPRFNRSIVVYYWPGAVEWNLR